MHHWLTVLCEALLTMKPSITWIDLSREEWVEDCKQHAVRELG